MVVIIAGGSRGPEEPGSPTFFQGAPGEILIYVFISAIIPLHECF